MKMITPGRETMSLTTSRLRRHGASCLLLVFILTASCTVNDRPAPPPVASIAGDTSDPEAEQILHTAETLSQPSDQKRTIVTFSYLSADKATTSDTVTKTEGVYSIKNEAGLSLYLEKTSGSVAMASGWCSVKGLFGNRSCDVTLLSRTAFLEPQNDLYVLEMSRPEANATHETFSRFDLGLDSLETGIGHRLLAARLFASGTFGPDGRVVRLAGTTPCRTRGELCNVLVWKTGVSDGLTYRAIVSTVDSTILEIEETRIHDEGRYSVLKESIKYEPAN